MPSVLLACPLPAVQIQHPVRLPQPIKARVFVGKGLIDFGSSQKEFRRTAGLGKTSLWAGKKGVFSFTGVLLAVFLYIVMQILMTIVQLCRFLDST